MANVTIDELAKLKGLAGKTPGGGGGGGGFWTPQNVNEVIQGIRDLIREAYAMRQGGAPPGPGQADSFNDPPGTAKQLAGPVQGVTMGQLYSFAKQVCANLEGQGHGDKTPFEVLQVFDLTIRQLREMIP